MRQFLITETLSTREVLTNELFCLKSKKVSKGFSNCYQKINISKKIWHCLECCFFFPSSLQCGWTIARPWPGWRGGCASRHQPPGPAPSIQTTNASPGAGRHLQGYAQALILSAQLKASTLLTKPFLVFTAVAREDNNIHIEELKAAGQKCKQFSLSAFCSLSQSIMKQSHTPNQTTFRDRVLQS